MNGIVRCTNRAGKTIGRRRHRSITVTDQRQVCALGCFGQMCVNRLDCEGAGNLTGIASAHTVTDDIESERRISHKAILVVRSFEAGIGFVAMQPFEGQTSPPLGRKTPYTGTEFDCKFFRAPIAVRQLFLQRPIHDLLHHQGKVWSQCLNRGMRVMGDAEEHG